jgi:alkaline phosphatase
MKRRDFFRNGALTTFGLGIYSSLGAQNSGLESAVANKPKNIIFLVSDGMSSGTLNMADLLKKRKFGVHSNWIQLYKDSKITRALMDTASLDSMVTDSAAASSSWGGGMRVNNNSLNVGPNGENYKPILQKFKDAGKSVGCVTTVPITHATPAGFCINHFTRSEQHIIAEKYLPLKFDVMMGGGTEYFSKDKRKDGKDMFAEFKKNGYTVVTSKQEWEKADKSKPVLGVYHENGLPYTVDIQNDSDLQKHIPTLAEMTQFAIDKMKSNPKGFVMQVEGGKVDWAAHANDAAAILYDQIAFDDAVKVAVDFAEKDRETLVIITTDHGNANPALFKGKKADENFDKLQNFKYSNEWVLFQINQTSSVAKIRETIEYAQQIVIDEEEAASLQAHYAKLKDEELYNPYKLPFEKLAQIQKKYTNIGWAANDHTGDYVELAMFGAGRHQLKPFVKNTDLHYFMLELTGVKG